MRRFLAFCSCSRPSHVLSGNNLPSRASCIGSIGSNLTSYQRWLSRTCSKASHILLQKSWRHNRTYPSSLFVFQASLSRPKLRAGDASAKGTDPDLDEHGPLPACQEKLGFGSQVVVGRDSKRGVGKGPR